MMAKGYVFGLVYIGLTATSIVFLHHVGRGIPIAVGLFYMALAASVVFNVIEHRNVARNHRSIARHKGSFALLSISFVTNWLFSYYSATHASPDFFIAVFFLTSALLALVRSRSSRCVAICSSSAPRCTSSAPGLPPSSR